MSSFVCLRKPRRKADFGQILASSSSIGLFAVPGLQSALPLYALSSCYYNFKNHTSVPFFKPAID
ncbi:hypothetical protein K445DRAFT_317276 [Daldinia sp. EC12]|nr:hypothetical protein K445DRAFT_317276 [Daldinia sp. EC12]